jgi:16S rRNA G1207 methylase RsmC
MPKSLIHSVVVQLQKERKRLEDELHRVTAALTAFGRVYLHGTKSGPAASRKKRTISPAGRKRIAAAQRKRWAKIRAGKK